LPYRIDIDVAADRALDHLVRLGALDIEATSTGVAAILPDSVAPETVAAAVGRAVVVSPAQPRDDESVWLLTPRPVRLGRLLVVPPGGDAPAGALVLRDSGAFGTGLHPTTALCVEAIEAIVDASMPDAVLDVGAGSGILALAALKYGVAQATALDTDVDALAIAAENARLNDLGPRCRLIQGGPESVDGTWPLVVANILPATLSDMAPLLTRRVARGGTLVLSGIPVSVASEVERAYRRAGMRHLRTDARGGWTALLFTTSW
jgi:ribosomal protein L11 methyltransferase